MKREVYKLQHGSINTSNVSQNVKKIVENPLKNVLPSTCALVPAESYRLVPVGKIFCTLRQMFFPSG